jgi:DNA-binding beta-propeller fold protein YncE
MMLSACTGGGKAPAALSQGTRNLLPQRIIPAPRALLAATGPQADGTLWAVAGSSSVGLFKFSSASGLQTASVSVSAAARSVAHNPAGVVAIALGGQTSGSLELLSNSGTRKKTIPLPAPARQVVSASSGSSFYVLTEWPDSASISTVSPAGRRLGTIPAPAGSVSIAADPQQQLIYVVQHNGVVDVIGLGHGNIESSMTVDGAGVSAAISPDGSRLYVLKATSGGSNIAVIDTATEGVVKVLPAPSHCLQLAVAPDGRHLYETVGTPGYGNIQVVGL